MERRRLNPYFYFFNLLWIMFVCPAAFGETLTWQACVQEAQGQNPDLQSAIRNVEKLKLQVSASRSDYFPQITGNSTYNVSNSASTSNFNPDAPIDIDTGNKKQFQIGATLQQNIFDGFGTSASIQRSKALLAEAEANLKVVKSQVSAELKTAFAQLLFFQKQLDVNQKIITRREENVRFIELRFEGGRENQGSLLRNQALWEQAKFNYSETQRALSVAKRNLAKSLGRDYAQSFDQLQVAGDFSTQLPKSPPDFNRLTEEHPEHGRSSAQVATAKADVKLAKSDLYPALDGSASITERKLSGSDNATLWSTGVNLNYPFFTGGRDIFEVRAAKTETLRVQENLRSSDNKLTLQLKQSYKDFQDAVANIQVQQGFLRAAQVRAEIARSQYANGLLSYQDWDSIENDLINNEGSILGSLRDALIAEANWEKAQGTGDLP